MMEDQTGGRSQVSVHTVLLLCWPLQPFVRASGWPTSFYLLYTQYYFDFPHLSVFCVIAIEHSLNASRFCGPRVRVLAGEFRCIWSVLLPASR